MKIHISSKNYKSEVKKYEIDANFVRPTFISLTACIFQNIKKRSPRMMFKKLHMKTRQHVMIYVICTKKLLIIVYKRK